MSFFRRLTWLAASLSLASLLACQESPSGTAPGPQPPDTGYPKPPSLPGMVSLLAGGQTLRLGSDDPLSHPLEEKPRMPVTFRYHFALDSFEVTQGLWKRVMQQAPEALEKTGVGDSLPVYQVSWYDAVLFCNARSRAQGFDTVYSYAGVVRDAKGHARDLVGLVTHFDRLGFRLPTEAEWQWAASEGGVTDRPWSGSTPDSQGWYIANSKGRVHRAGAKLANRFGLHDMLGNVMEWTQDWKAGLKAEALTDYGGGLYPSTLEEKVVKGGSFMSAMPQMRPGARGATYPIAAASVLEYVGFRCALGRIDEPRFLNGNGQAMASLEALQWLIPDGTKRYGNRLMRVAVVRTGRQQERVLQVYQLIDHRLSVKEVRLAQPVFAPVFSPDGRWIAWSTTGEGMTKKGAVKVMASDLADTATLWTWEGATLPRWHVDSTAHDTLLVAASSGIDNTDADFASGFTYRVRMRAGRPDGPVETLSPGAYHDGLSPRGDFLASGYRHLRVKEMATGLESVLFTAKTHGKPGEDTAQACNVSWRPDANLPAQLLFLDFGSANSSALVGRPYGIHEIAFLIDARGEVLRHFAVPAGYAAFADLEWSNEGRYAVTVLEDAERNPSTLAVLDAETGITTPLLSGQGLAQPALWFDAPRDTGEALSEAGLRDSLFRYEEPYVQAQQGGFARKVRLFFEHADRVEAVLVGSSHFEMGLVSDRFLGGKAVNLAISSTWHYTSELLLTRYVVPHAPKLKVVVFNVLLGTFATHVGEPFLDDALFPSRGYRFDEAHQFWQNGLPAEVKTLAKTLPQPGWIPTDSMGNYLSAVRGWGPDPAPVEDWVLPALNPESIQIQMNVFIRVIQYLKSKGIAVLLVETPKHPAYGPQGNGYMSYNGPSVSDGEKIHALIQAACADHPRCAFYDAHRFGRHDYVFDDFYDQDHLSRQGAEKLSTRLDSAIAVLLRQAP